MNNNVINKNRKVYIGGNWKCNGDFSFIKKFEEELASLKNNDLSKVDIAIFPTSLHIANLSSNKELAHITFGSQNISQYGNGAYTGEISPKLLLDINIDTTLIGHSERRNLFNESEEVLSSKLKNAELNNFKIVYCIGEKLEDRESNKTMEVIIDQLNTVKSSIKCWENIVIAYEPVWAIGTGKTATPEQAEEVHCNIRKWLSENIDSSMSERTRIIYGGSVNGDNCDKLISQKNIDGFLVGGASLKPEFKKIVNSYEKKLC